MKFVAVLIFIVIFCFCLYIVFIHLKKINWKVLEICGAFGAVLLVLFLLLAWRASKIPDSWCTHFQNTTNYPPMQLSTAMDWFEMGNFDYDTGNCKKAVEDYTKSFALNPKYPQTLNNLAYTQMRMGDYKNALENLNTAIELNPNYVNALMNRGDIYNYHLKDRIKAITDYQKIISLVGTSGTTVCGHLAMAKHDSKNIFSFFLIPFEVFKCK